MDGRRPGGSASRRAKTELEHARDVRLTSIGAVVAGAFLGWLAVFAKALVLEATATESGYIIPIATVMLAAWVGGVLGGVTAIVVTFVLNSLIFLDPTFVLMASDDQEVVRQVLFLVIALGATVLVATRRASRDRLANALDEAADLAAAVEERDDRLEMMLAASGTGFWEWDMRTGKLDWSEAIFRQHGLDPSVGEPDFPAYLATIHPDDRQPFVDAIDEALAGRQEFSIEFRVLRPDGDTTWTHGAARVYRDDEGVPIRMLGTGQDVTERRRLAMQRDTLLADERRAAEFRDAFVDVISHELRTPITTILGLTQILARSADEGRIDRVALLDDVRAESERLHRLIEDLLVLSRVERGRLEVELEPLHLGRLLRRIVEHELAELPSITIDLHMARELPIVVGDETYVEQVLRNLLENAAKYGPVGGEVLIDARADGDVVAIVVEDRGAGVPAASRQHLFDLFYRDPGSAKAVSGSGIGLFVCSNLVDAMGGRIWVDDAEGGGARFTFTLRIAETEADLDASGPMHGHPYRAGRRGPAARRESPGQRLTAAPSVTAGAARSRPR